MTITSTQVKEARKLLGWSVPGLAGQSGVDLSVIQCVLETAGTEFIAENGGGAGVR